MDQKSIYLTKLPARMEQIPPYETFLCLFVQENIAQSSSQPPKAEHEKHEIIEEHLSSGCKQGFNLIQPSRSASAMMTILQNEEILFKQ